jgi:hypothetical protein
MSDAMEVSDRISAICRETWDRLTQAMMRNEPARLTEWPMTRPSREEIIDAAVDGGLFDGLVRRIDKEPVSRTQMLAVGAVQELHTRLLKDVQKWAEASEWNNAGEPTDALRKAVRAMVALISRGGELRGSCHRHALDVLGELLWEAQDRDCGGVVLRALCDELVRRDTKGLISRFDTVSIMEEMENRGFNPHEAFSEAVSRRAGNRSPSLADPIWKDESGISASSIEIGRYVIITWTQESEPYHVSRDPLNGPAQETRNLSNDFVQSRYVWNNQFLGRGDEPFDLVLERFAEDFPRDFAASVDRWVERMMVWREEKPSRFEDEATKMAEAAMRMSPIHGQRIMMALEHLGVDLNDDSRLRM